MGATDGTGSYLRRLRREPLPPSAKFNDDTLIVCEDCGQTVGSVGDFKARAAAVVLDNE
jgi:hypothetical protein